MKNIVLLLILSLMSACSSEDMVVIGELSELDDRFFSLNFKDQEQIDIFEEFFDDFIEQGEEFSEKEPPKWEPIKFAVDDSGWLEENNLNGIFVHLYMEEKYIIVNSNYWAMPEGQEKIEDKIRQRRNLIFHELGHAVLNRGHVSFWSVMLSTTQHHMVLDFELLTELFNFEY